MTHVRSGKQLYIQCPNEPGTFAKVGYVFANAGINIISMSAYGEGNKGYVWIVTENNQRSVDELRRLGYTVQENDVVLVEVENRPGTFAPIARILGDAHINIDNCYFTTQPTGGGTSLCVFHTANNRQALALLQQKNQEAPASAASQMRKAAVKKSAA